MRRRPARPLVWPEKGLAVVHFPVLGPGDLTEDLDDRTLTHRGGLRQVGPIGRVEAGQHDVEQPAQAEQVVGLAFEEGEDVGVGLARGHDQGGAVDRGPGGQSVPPLEREGGVAGRHLAEEDPDLGVACPAGPPPGQFEEPVFPPAVPPNAAGQLVDRPPGEAGGAAGR